MSFIHRLSWLLLSWCLLLCWLWLIVSLLSFACSAHLLLTLSCRYFHGIIFQLVSYEVVLTGDLLAIISEDLQVNFMNLLDQMLPIWVFNKVEKITFLIVVDEQRLFTMAQIDLLLLFIQVTFHLIQQTCLYLEMTFLKCALYRKLWRKFFLCTLVFILN